MTVLPDQFPNIFVCTLAQSLSLGGSEVEIFLSTIKTLDGQAMQTADFAYLGEGILSVDVQSAQRAEFISFTGVSSGNTSVTGATRGLSFKNKTVIPANKKFHPVGVPVIIAFGTHNLIDLEQIMINIQAEIDILGNTYLKRDGTNSPTADINWGNHKITNLADGSNPQDAVNVRQLQAAIITPISNVQIPEVANQVIIPGNTVGISPFSSGVAFADRGTTPLVLPDTVDNNSNPRQVWLGDDRVFIVYKVNGTTTLKGIVGTVDRDTMTISFGSATTYSTTLQASADYCVVALDTDKVGVLFAESGSPTQIIIDISTTVGNVITPSGNQSFGSTLSNDLNYIVGVGVDVDTAVIYKTEATSANPQVVGFNVSGTTLGTVGTPTTAEVSGLYLVKTNTLTFALASTSAAQAGTVTAGTMAIAVGSSVNFPNATNNAFALTDIVSPTTSVIFCTYGGGSGSGNVAVGSISGNAITFGVDGVTASIGSYGWNGAGGATVVATNQVLVPSSANYLQLFTFTGTTINSSVDISGTNNGSQSGLQHCFVELNGYWVNLSISNIPAGALNNTATILGMSFTSKGIAQTSAARTASTQVLIKGLDIHQTNLVTGELYEPDGNGGVAFGNPNGLMQASSTSSLII